MHHHVRTTPVISEPAYSYHTSTKSGIGKFVAAGCNLKNAKHYNKVIRPPLFDIELDHISISYTIPATLYHYETPHLTECSGVSSRAPYSSTGSTFEDCPSQPTSAQGAERHVLGEGGTTGAVRELCCPHCFTGGAVRSHEDSCHYLQEETTGAVSTQLFSTTRYTMISISILGEAAGGQRSARDLA